MSTRPPAPTPPSTTPPAAPPEPVPTPPPRSEPPVVEGFPQIPVDPVAVAREVDLTTSNVIAQLSDDNAALRAQVAEMASAMAKLRRQVLEASEGELVKLALVIADRVIARELATSPALVVQWAREAIDSLAAKDEVVIAVAKDGAPDVPAEAWAGLGVPHEIAHDPQLAPGTIEVRTPQGIVAIGPEARLAAVANALGVAPS